MHRFFAEEQNISKDHILLTGGDVNHVQHVLRLSVGDCVQVSDGKKYLYECMIDACGEEEVRLSILRRVLAHTELSSKITLFQALPKGDKMEVIIQKSVELGVFEVIPVATKRCVVKLDERKAARKTDRWNAISESAAKQSGRGIIPEVRTPMAFDTALAVAQEYDHILIPYELSEGMKDTREVMSRIKPGESVAIFIGPEGGFEILEIELAKAAGARAISLGKRILRTETAGLAILSVLMMQLEDE